MRYASFAISACAAVAGFAEAHAEPAKQIGSALVVVNKVTAELQRDVRTLSAGDRVRHSEIIQAGEDARTELKLDDQTKLALGPGAKLALDKFVYDPDKTGGAILVNLAKGAFRFMTGMAAKPAYVIRTPTASITVRGTIFDVFVPETGETWLMLSEGGVQACNARGKCRIVDRPGTIIRVGEDGDVGAPDCWSRLGRQASFTFDEAFPFVVSPPSIDPKPEFTRAVLTGADVCQSSNTPRRTELKSPTKQVKAEPKSQPAVRKLVPATPVVKVATIKTPRRNWTPPVRVVEIPRVPIVIRPGIRIRLPDYDEEDDWEPDDNLRATGLAIGMMRRGLRGIHRPRLY